MSETAPSQVPLVVRLKELGLYNIAARAEQNEFHDYLTPHAMPQHVLVDALDKAAKNYPSIAPAILQIRRDVIDGIYDATKEESDAWAKSPEGQDVFRQLYQERKKH